MSADNFYVVDYVPDHVPPWAVTMGFMSDDEPVVPSDRSGWFTTAADAVTDAHEQFAEYGVEHTAAASEQMAAERKPDRPPLSFGDRWTKIDFHNIERGDVILILTVALNDAPEPENSGVGVLKVYDDRTTRFLRLIDDDDDGKS